MTRLTYPLLALLLAGAPALAQSVSTYSVPITAPPADLAPPPAVTRRCPRRYLLGYGGSVIVILL